MPKQNKLLKSIADKNQELSEAEIAQELQKTQLEEVDLITLNSLVQLGFLSKESRQSATTIRLSDRYQQYRQTFTP